MDDAVTTTTIKHEPGEDLQLEEELQILEERVRPPKTLSADIFLRPIGDLCQPSQKLITLAPGARVTDAIRLLQQHRIGAVACVL